MSFHSPHLLWLLAPLLALFSWELARHTVRAVAAWPKIPRAWAGAFEVSLGTQHTTAETRPRIWLWFGLACCIVALARPQWGVIEEQVFDQSREVLIAVDLSRSMLAQDVRPSRLDRSKLLVQSLLDGLKGERVGLVLFAGTSFLQSPLSSDYEILREFLPAMNPDYLPEGGSNYRAMLEASIQAFGTSTADRYLIILSDGESTDENWKELTDSLKQKGIRVIGLGVGTAQGAFIPDGNGGYVKDERGAVVLSRLNSSTLQELAQVSGGAYTDASAWVDLPALLRKTIEAGRKGEFAEKNTARKVERFQWFLAPGLLLLLISFWVEFPVRPRERQLPLASLKGGRPRATGNPTLSVAGLLVAVLWFADPPPLAAQPGPGTEPSQSTEKLFTEPLKKKVVELVGKELRGELAAKDYAGFADTTLTYGRRLREGQTEVPKKPVQDALEAVDHGEKLDAHAADWPKLRTDLQELLKKPEQKDDKKNQDQKKDQQQNQKNQQNQDKDQQQQNQDQQKSDQQKQDEQKQQQQQQQKQNQDAFGDMKDKQDQKKPQPPQPGTQKVGGQQDKKPEDQQQDPELAMPLQKLEQVRSQDSPAKLQQILQQSGRPQKPTAKPGKDW